MKIQRKKVSKVLLETNNSVLNNLTPPQKENEIPSIVQDVLASSGQALDGDVRTFMEPRFGHDFRNIRIHADEKATRSAQAVGALAYTVGNDIVFGEGQYRHGECKGKRLLAHELTHVVQNEGGPSPSTPISAVSDGTEREAEQVASTIMTGQHVRMQAYEPSAFLQRQEDPSTSGDSQPNMSLLPPGQESSISLQDWYTLNGITPMSPLGSPRWLTPPNLTTDTTADTTPKLWELDFGDGKIDRLSPFGRHLTQQGFSLQSNADQAQDRGEQLHRIITGKEVNDTPMGLQLLNAGANIAASGLGLTSGANDLAGKLGIDQVTVVIDPTQGTYGGTVQFLF